MNSLGLKWKISLVGVLPFLCFIMFSIYDVKQNYNSYVESELLVKKLKAIDMASSLVHETQKERGLTASFLEGSVQFPALEEQRQMADKKIEGFRNYLPNSSFSESYRSEILNILDRYKGLRSKVSSKQVELSEALGQYSSIVSDLLQIENHVADNTNLASISAKLRAFRILEDSKEAGGKLRANMTAILASNQPISDKQLGTVMTLKGGVEEGISSSGLVLDDKSKDFIDKFKYSNNWATVNTAFQTILKNAGKGNYYQDPKAFFGVITGSLNILGDLINHQKQVLLADVEKIKGESEGFLWKISGFILGLTAVVLGMMFNIANSTTKSITSIANTLAKNTDEVSSSSELISTTSIQMSEAATQSAANLQETVSSVDEISTMVARNAETAHSSAQVSKKSTDAANRGKQTVEHMIESINNISESNDQIMIEMQKNNEEISKIVDVIAEIGEKTKVINDIVFQTKLLSFNASVEAARAGEHGKGFAVVAEEVGNLASMSGKAAHEISEMLESSIKQVKDIVETSKSKIEGLVTTGKEKVEVGTRTAHECGEALTEILQNVNSVNGMVDEISSASAEQSAGIKQINTAMQELDEATHKNTSIAQETSSLSIRLRDQANSLENMVFELVKIVEGKAAKKHNLEKAPESKSDSKVLSLSDKRKSEQERRAPAAPEMKKAVGHDSSVPSSNDPRFEEL